MIEATMRVIAQHGLSGITLQRVAEAASITAGMVNFHFKSKEALLTATLEALVQEYAAELSGATALASDPAEVLSIIVERHFSPPIVSQDRLALWYAYWGEAQARHDYRQICAEADRFLWQLAHEQLMSLNPVDIDQTLARGITSAFIGLLTVMLQEQLLQPEIRNRQEGIATCLAFLHHLFPHRTFGVAGGRRASAEGRPVQATVITERSGDWVVSVLREVDANLERGISLADTCRRQGWDPRLVATLKSKFDGMSLEQIRYVLALETRNLRLTESLADRVLHSRDLEPRGMTR
jgi:TetR/AcrR family transcriptional repressor of bet genes